MSHSLTVQPPGFYCLQLTSNLMTEQALLHLTSLRTLLQPGLSTHCLAKPENEVCGETLINLVLFYLEIDRISFVCDWERRLTK